MVYFAKAAALVALSAVASATPVSRQGCAPMYASCDMGERCCGGYTCTPTPWEPEMASQCLPTPPRCYEPGQRSIGADGEMYVPFAPCCDRAEPVTLPGEYGLFCPITEDEDEDLEIDASGEPTDEPMPSEEPMDMREPEPVVVPEEPTMEEEFDPVTVAPMPEPPVTEPPVVDPPVTDPVFTDPVVTDPVVTDPVVTDPVVTEPPATDAADAAEPEIPDGIPDDLPEDFQLPDDADVDGGLEFDS